MTESDLRRALVERLVARGAARSPAVVRALTEVPRHLFLPGLSPDVAYADRSIALAVEDGVTVSSASQPSMIAEMLEQLDVRPGDRVLEIGTGSGYNAALLARLCGERGSVVSIDLDEGLVARARTALAAAGVRRVRVLAGDGATGAPEAAPFDRIILTVAADDIVDAWRLQLARGGRLVLPLTLNVLQESIAFEGVDPMRSVSIVGASFVALRGSNAISGRDAEVGEEPVVRLRLAAGLAIDRERLAPALFERPRFVALAGIAPGDFWSGLDVWLDAHVAALALASATGSGDGACVASWLSVGDEPRSATTYAVCDGAAIAFAVRDHGRVALAAFGRADDLVEAVRTAARRWIERGRPAARSLRVEACARTAPGRADVLVRKASVTLALRWN